MTALLLDQLDFYLETHLFPRLEGLGDALLLAPIGPFGGWFADEPLAALVLHVSRETMHHGGEVGVLRDLFRTAHG